MTYGWALVLIVTVVSVLFFVFGAPASTTTFSSSDPTKILLRASNVSGTSAEIQLQNATGGKITINTISPTNYSNCTINGSASTIPVGAGSIMKLNCTAPSDNKGSIKIEYTDFAGLQRTVIINASGTSESNGGVAPPQMYEQYTTGDTSFVFAGGSYWLAQTFTPTANHKLTSVKLRLYRDGSPGTVTASIRATDGSDKPTGADLCSGTTDGSTLPTGSPFEWREITLSAGSCNLSAGTKYAIVLRSGASSAWRLNLSGAYIGGEYCVSANSGSTWGSNSAYDFMFEEWGIPS